MIIAKVSTLRLSGKAADSLSHSAYTAVQEWLATWTLDRDIKMVIADSPKDAVEKFQAHMSAGLIPYWLSSKGVKPEHFIFTISYSEVDGKDMFWSPGAQWVHDHSVAP